jgi:hypothetical protein
MLGIDWDFMLAVSVGALNAGAEDRATVAAPEVRMLRLDTSSACPSVIVIGHCDLPPTLAHSCPQPTTEVAESANGTAILQQGTA